jgi:hypothetical protein
MVLRECPEAKKKSYRINSQILGKMGNNSNKILKLKVSWNTKISKYRRKTNT